MNVKDFNLLLSRGEIDRPEIWPRIADYEARAVPFQFEFGIDRLPKEPGLIIIRGPRQYGKSTWMDLQLRDTIIHHGKGSAYYLNGDEIPSSEVLYERLVELDQAFEKSALIRRIFVDEITAVVKWQKAIKRAYDAGHLRRTLLITTGSKAFDLRRGAERLPGRKGRLGKTDYLFLPISYRQFHEKCGDRFGDRTWIAYLLTGGAPLALNDMYEFGRIQEYFPQLIQDWILGEVITSGRSRLHLRNVLSVLFRGGGQPIGFAKLARESGLANNTVAAGYVEQLSDLLCLAPQWAWDEAKNRLLFRRPCKFAFVNLAAVAAFHPSNLRRVEEFEGLPGPDRAVLLEWLVAQEIWRRAVLTDRAEPESLGFWQSSSHEIDFVTPDRELLEVKLEKAGPLDFTWFSKTFPKKDLTVICSTPFSTRQVRGLNVHDFLMGTTAGQDDRNGQ